MNDQKVPKRAATPGGDVPSAEETFYLFIRQRHGEALDAMGEAEAADTPE